MKTVFVFPVGSIIGSEVSVTSVLFFPTLDLHVLFTFFFGRLRFLLKVEVLLDGLKVWRLRWLHRVTQGTVDSDGKVR